MVSLRKRSKRERDWRRERREFVYLDEVSVISLVAARDGGIADSITEQLSRTVEAESSSTVSLPIKGGAEVGAESRHMVSDTSSKEVVRRTVIQSTFGDLRFGGSNTSRPLIQEYRDLPEKFVGCVSTVKGLSAFRSRKLRRLMRRGLLTPLNSLRRGDVIEIDIQLRPDKAFSIAAAIDSFVDLMQGREHLFGDVSSQIAEAIPIGEVLNRLMVGLVPIHGAPTSIVLVEIGGQPYLVDQRILKTGSPIAATTRPWEIVGVTEQPSYWKDLRRILYTRERFTIYARLIESTLIKDWNPVKIAGLMGDVSEDAARAITSLPHELVHNLENPKPERAIDLRGMFHEFAALIEENFAVVPDSSSLNVSITEAVAIFNDADGEEVMERAAFNAITAAYEKVNASSLDREQAAEKRELARSLAEVSVATAALPASTRQPTIDQLEVEVVAVYW